LETIIGAKAVFLATVPLDGTYKRIFAPSVLAGRAQIVGHLAQLLHLHGHLLIRTQEPSCTHVRTRADCNAWRKTQVKRGSHIVIDRSQQVACAPHRGG